MKTYFQLHPTIRVRLIMVFFGVLCSSAVTGSMTIYYNHYMGAGVTGILLMISSVLVFVIGLWAGHLSDLRGRRPLMIFADVLSVSGAAVATFANSPLLTSPWLTYFGFLVFNFGYGFFNTASQAMLVDLTNSENRRDVYSIQYWFINFGFLLGAALSGWFFRDFLFWLLLVLTLEEAVNLLVMVVAIPESFKPEARMQKKAPGIFRSYLAVSKDLAFMYYLLASVGIAMIFNQMSNYLPVYLADHFQTARVLGFEIYGQRMLSVVLMINTALIVVFMGFSNKLTKNWTRKTGLTAGIFLNGLGFALAFLGKNFGMEALASVIMTVGEMILVPVSQALRADLMEGEKVGTYQGAFSVTQPVASVLSGGLVSLSGVLGNVGMALILGGITFAGIAASVKAVTLHERPKMPTSS
ncbi:MAG: MFS transporter [Streptococcaceae bacterium]|jgi:DHA1 family multidrug resistance protein B-like MFS transporter|nr:MFS transporter [Streptococcaceae bacterium]